MNLKSELMWKSNAEKPGARRSDRKIATAVKAIARERRLDNQSNKEAALLLSVPCALADGSSLRLSTAITEQVAER